MTPYNVMRCYLLLCLAVFSRITFLLEMRLIARPLVLLLWHQTKDYKNVYKLYLNTLYLMYIYSGNMFRPSYWVIFRP
jgi:hypothetical protein